MRRIGLMDLHHAARAVQMVPSARRVQFCAQLLSRAHAADKYVKRLRKLHPDWGDGSLRAAAHGFVRSAYCGPDCPSLRDCYLLVLQELDRRSGRFRDKTDDPGICVCAPRTK